MLRNLLIVIILFFACPLSVFGRVYTIGIVEWEPWSIAWIAEEKGFWQQEGLEVEVQQFSEYGNGCLRAFKFGRVDFAMMMLGNAVELINLSPRYLILHENNWSHGGDYFIVDRSIKVIEDLKGKKIGLYSHSLPVEFFVEKILHQGGLCTRGEDVKIYEVSNTRKLNAALERGTFSAIVNYGADAMEIISRGKGRKMFTSADFPGSIPEGIVVQRCIVQNNPADVEKFLRGWMRAVQWREDPANRREVLTILRRTMFKGKKLDQDILDQLVGDRRLHATLAEIRKADVRMAPAFIKELLVFMKKRKGYCRTMDINEYLHTGMAVKAAKEVLANSGSQ